MNVYQACYDTSDATELFLPQNLFLKPIARLNISVQLPLLKVPGKSISNWEVMEKVRNIIKPDEFSSLKVSKSTLEFVRLEGEVDNKSKIPNLLSKLDSRTITLSGFSDVLKVRAAEAKIPYPTRHMWDSYFRDSKHMNDIKPGERPDTIHICNLPTKWFSDKSSKSDGRDVPSDYIFKKVFEAFGEVRVVDIPMLDPLRNEMKNTSGISTFYFGQDHSFEGYVQFKEYVCFVKAMTALKGMKLLYKDGEKAWTASIKVDFDKTKHLSDDSIRKRALEREKILLERKLQKEEEERKLKEIEDRKREEENRKIKEEEAKAAREKQLTEERQKRRENRKKEKELLKQKQLEEEEKNIKLSEEKEAMALECRRIQSMRLLGYLLEKARIRMEKELILKKKEELLRRIEEEKKLKRETEMKDTDKVALVNKEKELRGKLMTRYKSFIQKRLQDEEKKLNKLIEAKRKVLTSSIHACALELPEVTGDQAVNHSLICDLLGKSTRSGNPKLSDVDVSGPKESSHRKKNISLPTAEDQSVSRSYSAMSSTITDAIDGLSSSDSSKDLLSDNYLADLAEFCDEYLSSSSKDEVHHSEQGGKRNETEDFPSGHRSGRTKKRAHDVVSTSREGVSTKNHELEMSSKPSKLSKV